MIHKNIGLWKVFPRLLQLFVSTYKIAAGRERRVLDATFCLLRRQAKAAAAIKERIIMALIKWKEEYSVKVPEIDEQHKKLIDLINQLADAMSVGKGRDVLKAVLAELVDYTEYHFRTEEGLLREHGYPGQDRHFQAHEQLTARAAELRALFEGGEARLSIDVMLFLSDWLNRHILGEDKQYAPYLAGKRAR
jgi:hemerythrin